MISKNMKQKNPLANKLMGLKRKKAYTKLILRILQNMKKSLTRTIPHQHQIIKNTKKIKLSLSLPNMNTKVMNLQTISQRL